MTDDELKAYYDAMEVQEFKRKRFEQYVFRLDLERRIATNHSNAVMGRIIIGKEIRKHGLLLYEIFVIAINGCVYSGVYSIGSIDRTLFMTLTDYQPTRDNVVPLYKPARGLQCPGLK